MAKQIVLDLDKDLTVSDDGKLTIKISGKTGNTLKIKDDGLYAEAKQGQDGSGGTGYTGHYLGNNGFAMAYTSPYNSNESPGRVAGTNIIHRVFTLDSATDKVENHLRKGIGDYVLPGDIYRVPKGDGKYNYHLVLTVSAATDTLGGNTSTSSHDLGTW